MKKIFYLLTVAAIMASCNNGETSQELKEKNESLEIELSKKNAQIENIVQTFAHVTECINEINRLEGEVNIIPYNMENSQQQEQIAISNLKAIKDKMAENRAQIDKLRKIIGNNKNASAKMKLAMNNLIQQLETKETQIKELEGELEAKNIRIREMDEEMDSLKRENEEKTATLDAQELEINTAWFVFGTKKELKDQNIISGGGLFSNIKVLNNKNVNKNYFTKIDIRTTKRISLFTKNAEILTTHPEGSYKFEKNGKGELSLIITNIDKFWSTSKYLVIRVK